MKSNRCIDSYTTNPQGPGSKYDYPIVRHHPLFAKSRGGPGVRSGAISSLLVGENVEYMRRPGDLSKSVQSVRSNVKNI